MGLERERPSGFGNIQEQLVPLPQKRGIFRGETMLPNVQEVRRLGEVRVRLSQKEQPPQPRHPFGVNDGFEPFIDPDNEDKLFVNDYGGNFWQDMELNREAIERVLRIAHLNGKVVLTSFSPNRQISIEANSDGSVSANRSLLKGQQIKQGEEEVSSYRVVNIGERGWRIDVNDKKITQELAKKRLSGDGLKKRFIKKFNDVVRDALFETVRREKLSSEKRDFTFFAADMVISIAIPGLGFTISSLIKDNFITATVGTVASFTLASVYQYLRKDKNRRKIDSFWEFFMPPIEVDTVIRTLAFLKGKGRILVREKMEEKGVF